MKRRSLFATLLAGLAAPFVKAQTATRPLFGGRLPGYEHVPSSVQAAPRMLAADDEANRFRVRESAAGLKVVRSIAHTVTDNSWL